MRGVEKEGRVKGEILNVLVCVAMEQYRISFGAVGRGLSISRSLEIVIQDDGLKSGIAAVAEGAPSQ